MTREVTDDRLPTPDLLDHFQDLPDPWIDRTRRHHSLYVIAITLYTVICGAATSVTVAVFGRAKRDWLATFLALPDSIPSRW